MTRTRWMTIAAGMTAGLLAGSAVGSSCPDADKKHKGHEHTEHVHIEHVHAAPAPAHSAFEVINVEGGDKYEIIVRDGKTMARVNGILVADELVKAKDGQVKILSDDGKVLKEFAINVPRRPAPGQAPGMPRRYAQWAGNLATTPDAPTPPSPSSWQFYTPYPEAGVSVANVFEAERPPVMLGVLLDGPSEALQAQLGVSEYAIVIEKVMKGLPADKAGLRQWDIIIEIDGDEIDTDGFLGDVLMESEPGDELDLVVIRRGNAIDLELELVAYDAKKLGGAGSIEIEGRALPGTQNRFFGNDQRGPGQVWVERGNTEAQRAIEQAMRQLEELGINEDASRKLREQVQRMERELNARAKELQRSRPFTLKDGKLIIDEEEAERAAEELEERLEDLEDQLEDRLEALEDRLEERWERMEEMFDRMFDRFEDMLEKSRDDLE